MYSDNLFPVITKPSRITTDTATLIDNIFTNNIESKIEGGLLILISDITDHLPVFSNFQNFVKEKKKKRSKTCKFIRHRTPEAIAALKEDLRKQNWDDVYANEDPNKAYRPFCPHSF